MERRELADKIDLLGLSVASFASAVTGSLSQASMSADLLRSVTVLGAHRALLFTATAGDMDTRSFLIIDANGNAGFQPGGAFVIEIANPANPIDNVALFS